MDQVQAKGLRVDFIAMHWYGWNAGSCVAGQLEGAVRWAEQWGKPIWITEFGCMGTSNPDEQTLLDFFPAAVAMLEKHPQVERYAWYPWNTYNELFLEEELAVVEESGQHHGPVHRAQLFDGQQGVVRGGRSGAADGGGGGLRQELRQRFKAHEVPNRSRMKRRNQPGPGCDVDPPGGRRYYGPP